ncbi:hypothetical protein DNTS_007198 [Danionella cerebrum]|uniref:Uncharacterized protein n=1 Tax=Danionella cerebrum TaxID=2873325 RepID=A0A553QR35_9TELE|nr:hypothetical protein DNTS_007198 [Danionella translucida]TRY92416.1 hypothetical protein DNTS_007198 [Danionella translucida]
MRLGEKPEVASLRQYSFDPDEEHPAEKPFEDVCKSQFGAMCRNLQCVVKTDGKALPKEEKVEDADRDLCNFALRKSEKSQRTLTFFQWRPSSFSKLPTVETGRLLQDLVLGTM